MSKFLPDSPLNTPSSTIFLNKNNTNNSQTATSSLSIKSTLLILFLYLFSLPLQGNAQTIPDAEILKHGFVAPLVKTFGLYNPVVRSIHELNDQLMSVYVPAESFYGAYDSLDLQNHAQTTDSIFKLSYTLSDKSYDSYSLVKPVSKGIKANTAILIIPGSGDNQATEIFSKEGYHGDIVDQVADLGDVFITVKPNEGFLAIHNGWSKLGYSFLTNYLINIGGSYSASYLINSLATAKYLKENYERVFIIGLSQGGSAALLNSLQSSPDATVVSSGFTITREEFEWANPDQIVIPGLVEKYSNTFLHERMESQQTNYFFSWATNEMGIYKMEAYNGFTKDFFKELTNIEYLSHNQGHNFPKPMVHQFLSKIPLAQLELIRNGSTKCDDSFYLKAKTLKESDNLRYTWFLDGVQLGNSTDSLNIQAGGLYKVIAKNQYDKIISKEIYLDDKQFNRQITFKHSTLFAPEGFEYQWIKDDAIINSHHTNQLLIEEPGVYSVLLKSEKGCVTSTTVHITEEQLLAEEKLAVEVFPNPSFGSFKVKVTTPYLQDLNFSLHNYTGQLVFTEKVDINGNVTIIDLVLPKLSPGIYFAQISNKKRKVIQKIIIQ